MRKPIINLAKSLLRLPRSKTEISNHLDGSLKNDEGKEEIRLVIWDLDDTFWKGTLTEGGIEYIQAHHDIVVELARRGILSSICSRNDYETIKELLIEKGIWDYFVLADIAWTSKGPRLKRIAEASRLRSPTILFIDDNPMNRAEAKRFVDGINVADPISIGELLINPRLKGKDDCELTRLKQYKLLEQRNSDMDLAGNSDSFLRDSNIRVYIEHDILSHIDRAIELINRTNQLNFTKIRLSEDKVAARNELSNLLNSMEIQSGLIRVLDQYGDYGFCGLYIQHQWLHGGDKPKLIHFCFSCRTLGMDVETWLYQRLGSPELEVIGNVLVDIKSNKPIDWVRIDTDSSDKSRQDSSKKVSRIFIRGGCEAVAISHYFQFLTSNLVCEFAFERDGLDVRLDHSQMLRMSLEKPGDDAIESLLALGYQQSDFVTAFLPEEDHKASVYILGLWSETNHNVFRHDKLGSKALMNLHDKLGIPVANLLSPSGPLEPEILKTGWRLKAIRELRESYEFEGRISRESTKENILGAIGMLAPNSLIFLIGSTEKFMDNDGHLHDLQAHIDLNNVLKSCTFGSSQIHFENIDEFIGPIGDRLGAYHHYSREVYYRLSNRICQKIAQWMDDS